MQTGTALKGEYKLVEGTDEVCQHCTKQLNTAHYKSYSRKPALSVRSIPGSGCTRYAAPSSIHFSTSSHGSPKDALCSWFARSSVLAQRQWHSSWGYSYRSTQRESLRPQVCTFASTSYLELTRVILRLEAWTTLLQPKEVHATNRMTLNELTALSGDPNSALSAWRLMRVRSRIRHSMVDERYSSRPCKIAWLFTTN